MAQSKAAKAKADREAKRFGDDIGRQAARAKMLGLTLFHEHTEIFTCDDLACNSTAFVLFRRGGIVKCSDCGRVQIIKHQGGQ